VDWLSLLKHPYAACGLAPAECRSRARHVELTVWRKENAEAAPWLDELKSLITPMTQAWNKPRPLGAWMEDHIRIAEKFAASDQESGAERLWRGAEGDTATDWLDEVRSAAANFALVRPVSARLMACIRA
jgi:ATP-dependent helicase/nuclease subunit B